MDDFGMLARDFGFKPQGKSAPMKSDGVDFRSRPPSSSSPFAAEENQIFNDVFGGPPKFSNNSRSTSPMSDIDYDSIFKNSASTNSNEAKSKSMSSNLPVYDKPVYDDDIFDGLPGMKSKSMHSASAKYEDNIFASMTASPPKRSQQSDHFDDLLGNLGRTEKVEPPKHKTSKSSRGLDDLLPGFGSGGPASSSRSNSESAPVSTGSTKETSNGIDDPFVVLESTSSTPATSSHGVFIDPLEAIHRFSKSASTNAAGGSSVNGGMFDDLDPLHGFGKPAPAFPSETNKGKDQSPFKEGSGMGSLGSSTRKEPTEKSSFTYSESQSQKVPLEDFQESQQTIFDMPAASKISQRSVDQTTSPPSYTETSQVDMSPKSEEYVQPAEDIWLTVSEIPLFTQPTRAPPPSRPPPPIPRHASKSERGSFASNNRTVGNDYSASPNSSKYPQSYNPFQPSAKTSMASPLDDLENFAMGGMPNNGEDDADAQYGEEMDSNSAAAAMKDAMDRAEAKFKHAKEVKERENAKASRNKESVKLQKDEMSMEEDSKRERQERERQQREREEQSRLEKERMREIEREKARQAVERATREARERAAIEAREKASAEARLKSERAAVQRAQAEARERAAIDARGRAERAAAEARERASAETSERAAAEAREKAAREKAAVARAEADAKRRAERIAVERVAAEARERAAVDARDRAAAARMNQQKNENDLESFFNMGSRPSSAPRPRTASDSATDPLSQNRRGQEGAQRTSTTSNMRKASSTTNIVDDLSSIFGAAPSSAGGFQDVEGETEERRRARLERHQRTQDRAAKALEEKNQRDLQSQREQEERSRIGETLDSEIKRWAAGKEGNLRALLSTLQYVLWPGCGWQPLSLTDLITGANVKKAYRKATLCIHPDKVQQKGANLQQKYVAEKVFDLLKEAWNKFNSEELF